MLIFLVQWPTSLDIGVQDPCFPPLDFAGDFDPCLGHSQHLKGSSLLVAIPTFTLYADSRCDAYPVYRNTRSVKFAGAGIFTVGEGHGSCSRS